MRALASPREGIAEGRSEGGEVAIGGQAAAPQTVSRQRPHAVGNASLTDNAGFARCPRIASPHVCCWGIKRHATEGASTRAIDPKEKLTVFTWCAASIVFCRLIA
jgi:hypothetical protein